MLSDRLEKRIADLVLYGAVIGVLVFFYIPIATLILFSFTQSRFLSWPIPGFSLRWYGELLADRDFWSALGNSAQLAVLTTVFATILGLGGAFAWSRYRFRFQWAFRALTFADAGKGLVLGLCVAFMGMAADKLISAWAQRRKQELGIG